MLTYSSRTASFNATRSAADFRRLTGLDAHDENEGGKFGLSFPQPEDVDEESERASIEQEHNPSGTSGGSHNESREALAQPAAADAAVASSKGLQPSSNSPQNKVGQSSSSEAKSFVTTKGSKSRDGTSFVTAHESLKSPPLMSPLEGSETPPNNQGITSSPAIRPEANRFAGNSAVPTGDVGGGLRKTGSDERSTSSLLHHDGAGSEVGTSPTTSRPLNKPDTQVGGDNQQDSDNEASNQQELRAQQLGLDSGNALLEVPAEAYQDETPGQVPDIAPMRHAEPVSTGLVRFNIPDDLAHKGHQAKQKVSEARATASFQTIRKAKAADPGQLLKAERMLVRIEATKHEVPPNYNENDSLKIETHTVEKWREFIVACRKSTSGMSFVLQMTKTRVIPMLDKERQSKKSAHEVTLQRKITGVNMFSSLDKTIAIWAPWKKETRIYLFRPRSSTSSVEWFTFLNFILGWKSPRTLRIHVPDLDINLELGDPLRDADVMKPPANQPDSAHQSHDVGNPTDGEVARQIIERSIKALKQSDFEDILKTWSQQGERIGLAWKRYDRLEWVHGANEQRMYGSMAMQRTHDLELRPKRHYPTAVAKDPKTIIEEPTPVEGFLVRQTSQKGTHKRFGKMFFKRLYFSTFNHYFCFLEPGKAMPPKPPDLLGDNGAGALRASEIAKKIPLVYAVDPFPLQDGRIPWVSSSNVDKKRKLDQLAYEESERSLKLLTESEGYINLCHVVRVRGLRPGSSALPDQGHGVNDEDATGREAHYGNVKGDELRTFELELKNGLVIRLQAFNTQARNEWVHRLREIVEYWKIRNTEDMDLYKKVRQSNLEKLNIDEEMESFLGQEAEKWEVSRSIASPELFHMCGISCCRQVTVSIGIFAEVWLLIARSDVWRLISEASRPLFV